MKKQSFGEWLKETREAHGISCRELERLAVDTEMNGMARGMVNRIEAGERMVTAHGCIRTARAFGMNPLDVLERAGFLRDDELTLRGQTFMAEDLKEIDKELSRIYANMDPDEQKAVLLVIQLIAEKVLADAQRMIGTIGIIGRPGLITADQVIQELKETRKQVADKRKK